MAKQEPTYGPDNPHPLSTRKTELIWEGKYDEYGNRREVDIAGCAMPMQKIETIDEPASRLKPLGLFDSEKAHKDDFRNMLIWGDNKLVMASLLKDFKGKIDLIYIDPPFDVGADFTMDIPIGEGKESIGKDQSTLEMIAYRDMWGKGTDSYLHMMYAVDFDYQDGQPFEHHWQAYRTRKDRSLPIVSNHEFNKYPKKGKYTACVKVVDIFGCDTSITVEIEY